MNRKLFIIGLGVLLFGKAALASQAAATLYNQANRLYSQNQFSQAVELYLQAEKNGAHNSNLYYNLGNALYKSGDPGRAMAWWLRAERLNPRDPDLKANLKLAQAQVNKSLPAVSSSAVTDLFNSVRDLSPARGWGVLLCVWIWLFWCSLSLRVGFGRAGLKTMFSVLLLASVFLAAVSGVFYLSRRGWEIEPSAVVVAKEVSAKSGPGQNFTGVFNVPQGARVLLKECRSGFCSIELPPGMVGWVDEKSLEKI
jgi:hypothetical protein